MRYQMLIGSVVLALTLTPALGDDILPPEWRGQEGTTYQRWEFSSNDETPIPDDVANTYGQPDLTVYPAHPWNETWSNRDGVWPLSGAIAVDIPNQPVENPWKWVRVQLTWASEYPIPATPVVSLAARDLSGLEIPAEDITLEDMQDTPLPEDTIYAGQHWHHTTYDFRIEPNPAFETVYISGSVMVDELVIDTWCVPEPMTLSLLGAGGLALLRRRQ